MWPWSAHFLHNKHHGSGMQPGHASLCLSSMYSGKRWSRGAGAGGGCGGGGSGCSPDDEEADALAEAAPEVAAAADDADDEALALVVVNRCADSHR